MLKVEGMHWRIGCWLAVGMVTGWFGVIWAAQPGQEIQKPQDRKQVKIYIVTNLEGASGMYKFAQTREPGPLNEQAKEYLMGDIAAVVRGLRAGGATGILVLEGHGSGAFLPHLMEPGAKYITGHPRPGQPLWGPR